MCDDVGMITHTRTRAGVCGFSVFACGRHHFTFIEMSSLPWGTCVKLRPAAMLASIDSPGLRLVWSGLSPVAPERWPTPRQSSGGENRVSSPGHRLGAPVFPSGDMKVWNDTAEHCCIIYNTQTHKRVTPKRFVQAEIQLGKLVMSDR